MPPLTPEAWAFALAAAALAGMAKTGVPGLGILAVPLMAQAMDKKQATGVLLPVLMCADVLGILTYREGADRRQVARLLAWAVPGVVAGTVVFPYISAAQMGPMLGALLLFLIALALLRRTAKFGSGAGDLPAWIAPPTGILGGFTTMIANAAGPVMNLYLLAMRLPKEVFLPTAAWFFFFLNWIKLPFGLWAGIVTLPSLTLSAWLVPAALVGGLLGGAVARRVDQVLFERLAWILTIASAIKFLIG